MSIDARRTGPVLVLGELDGLHRGHRRLLSVARQVAGRYGRELTGVVFDVEHRERLLNPVDERLDAVLATGAVSCRALRVAAGVDAGELATTVIAAIGPSVVVVACPPSTIDDRRYPDLISTFRARHIDVIEVDRAVDEGGIVTSGRVRAAVESGDVVAAARLIGSAYTIRGTVERGQQLGRTIGFPTANLRPEPNRILPPIGVYAARATLPGRGTHDAAVNVGVRPTVDDSGVVLVEAHVLDFDGDLYGQRIEVAFHHPLRGERRFDGLDALTAQLARDVADARSLLGSDEPR